MHSLAWWFFLEGYPTNIVILVGWITTLHRGSTTNPRHHHQDLRQRRRHEALRWAPARCNEPMLSRWFWRGKWFPKSWYSVIACYSFLMFFVAINGSKGTTDLLQYIQHADQQALLWSTGRAFDPFMWASGECGQLEPMVNFGIPTFNLEILGFQFRSFSQWNIQSIWRCIFCGTWGLSSSPC